MSTQTLRTEAPSVVVPYWTLGDRLRKARHIADMDQRNFAEQLGVTASRIASWETDRAVPRDLVAIARRVELLTRIPAAWILGLNDEGPQPAVPAEDPERARRDSNPQPSDP